MIRKRILGLALIALLSPTLLAGTRAQGVKLYPVDEAYKDPSFKLFRDRLIAALKRRDRRFLLSILDAKILNSFGGDGGVKEFIEHWKLNAPNSRVWTELLTILSLGGSFADDQGQKIFEAPYVSSRWDTVEAKMPNVFDVFSCGAVIGRKIQMHSRPDSTAPVLALLSYEVLHADYERSMLDEATERYRWVKVKTFKGHEGYVRGDQIRSPIDYRAGFKKVRGKWMMYFLVAGD